MRDRLAVVVPVYGNQASLPELHARIDAATKDLDVDLTIQFVNDRSPDQSQGVLEELAAKDPRVRVLVLSRNHGSFTAIMAGMAEVPHADAVAVLSADLQDPPEKLPEMVAAWRAGPPVVLAVRARRTDPLLDRLTSRAFHAFYRRVVMADMPPGGFDFFLLDRRVVDVITTASEKNTSLVGLIVWSGFERAFVSYERAPRKHGRSLWTLRKKLNYAIDSVVSFSNLPVRAFTILGSCLGFLFVLYGLVTFGNALSGNTPADARGWSSLILVMLLIGSFTLLGMGILGEYLLNTLIQTRGRPLFVVDRRIGGGVSQRAQPPSDAPSSNVPVFDLERVSAPVAASLGESAARALASKRIVLGPEVTRFERELAAYLGVPHAIGVANGTDAITLALWSAGVGAGDRVLTTALSAPPTAVAILRAGAIPVFVDVDPQTLLLDVDRAREFAAGAKAIVPVHLYGNVCSLDPLHALAEEFELVVIEDCAQSFGSRVGEGLCGVRSHASAYSFYPTKNLGAYGDGGAVAVHDEVAAQRLRRMRMYGQNAQGECVGIGMNSRLDELQAALLSERLKVVDGQHDERRAIAARYDEELGFLDPVPGLAGRVPHLYVVRPSDREAFRSFLQERAVGTGCHYPLALPDHAFLAKQAAAPPAGGFPFAQAACARVVSLPCFPGLRDEEIARVIEACHAWREANS